MPRLVAVGLVVLGSLAGPRVAQAADSTPLPNNAVLKFDKFLIEDEQGKLGEPSDGEQVRLLLNNAHCTCGAAALSAQTFGYRITLTATTGLNRPVDIYVGTSCDDPVQINNTCLKVGTISSIDNLVTSPSETRIPLYQAINVKTTGACKTEIATATVWLMVDTDGNSTYDHWVTTAIPKPFDEASVKGIDTRAPTLPAMTASGSEESIGVSWDQPTDTSDLFYYQALCANLDDSPVEGVTMPDARYQRTSDVCTTSEMITLSPTPGPTDGTPVDVVPPPFQALDPMFLCGQAGMGETSVKISGLQNGTPYKVAVIAVDNYGNFTGTYFTTTITPKPVIDFWEDLNSRDSAVEGGCLLSTTFGDGNPLTRAMREFRDDTLRGSALGRWLTRAYYGTLGQLTVASLPARIAAGIALLPLIALALLWHLLGLPALVALIAAIAWRRRLALALQRWRWLRLAAPGAAAALLCAPRPAAADDFAPYWEDPAQSEPAALDDGVVKWHAGIRVGPYTPDIDLQFPQNAVTGMGPYQAMFGTYYVDKDGDGIAEDKHSRHVYQVLPMLDIDRIVWRGFGHIGVGGSVGYMQKTAYVYANGTNEDDPMRARSTASENTFRLIPLAATLTYRFTYLDDRWGIPVIPYVRGGLSYYLWWIKGPTGNLAKVCDDPRAAECDGEDKAYGGTPGVQASAGLAVRAERLDAAAARSMHNSGIQHAGFYGEVFWGRVDGFGSSSKLWVGDTTWFAGANFEF
jgi:hypothetical protein